ncbi:calcium-binding protein [Pseudonocardia sp. ICBG1293]|uniref:calcium-binding protein n=1 Tax=Pseudonocardia sp. ICBG1293 TaxID=2844382 RepID=UPI001CCBC881|nr:calcium-binding protein [Pseudonocardia sp. ICBG1293]
MTARSLVRRTGAVAASLTLAALAGVPLAGVASAAVPAATGVTAAAPRADTGEQAGDLDCIDLSRAQAQAVLDADPSDPNDLDRDDDGRACEGSDLVAAAGTGQVRTVPGGGVEAGDGSGGAGVDPTAFLLGGAGAVLAAGAGVVVWSGRRSGRAALPLTTRHS